MFGHYKIQYFVTLSVATASLCMGAISTWPTPVLAKFKNNETVFQITDHQIAWVLATNGPGYITGSLMAGYITDKLGRRATIIVSTLPLALGALIAIFAVEAWLLCAVRFLWGCGTGIVGITVVLYLSEIADKEIRGTLIQMTRVFFNIGSLFMMTVGPFISYRVLNTVIFTLPLCQFVACWWIPESPYFFLKVGKVHEAKDSLKKLRGIQNPTILEEELIIIQSHVRNDLQRSGTVCELFRGHVYRRAILVATGLKTILVCSGSLTITQYLGMIVHESNANIALPTVMIIFGVISFIVGLTTTVLVDRINRRPLLLYSCVAYALALTIVGLYFFLKDVIQIEYTSLTKFSSVPFVGIIISNLVFNLGVSSLIFIIPGEIFPLNIKSIAMSASSIYAGFLSFIVPHIYQFIKDYSGLCGAFWAFSYVSLLGAVFTYFYLPETKGKSLHEILKDIQGKYYVSCEVIQVEKNLDESTKKDIVELKLIDGEKDVKEES